MRNTHPEQIGFPEGDLASLIPLLIEINDLKRITSAGRSGSTATRFFSTAWADLCAGAAPASVAWRRTAEAVAAARLGDIDGSVLRAAGVPAATATEILQTAAETVGAVLPPAVLGQLTRALAESDDDAGPAHGRLPAFVSALAQQPRAGVTCPGRPRILLEPPENHADHCFVVAVYGVLLADRYGADPARVFVAALAHHFHNAGMPDSGFTGEMLLGPHLQRVMDHFTQACLGELDPALRPVVETARAILPNADTPEGRAFHAADVLDRVLQINQYTRAATLTPERMLGEMELVHAGPVKNFHDDVLRQAGLL